MRDKGRPFSIKYQPDGNFEFTRAGFKKRAQVDSGQSL